MRTAPDDNDNYDDDDAMCEEEMLGPMRENLAFGLAWLALDTARNACMTLRRALEFAVLERDSEVH